MICPQCSGELVERRRIKKDVSGIAYLYRHCLLCGMDFNTDNKEIVHKGDTYWIKKEEG